MPDAPDPLANPQDQPTEEQIRQGWWQNARGGWQPPVSEESLREMPEITPEQWAQSIGGPYMEIRKILRARREIKREAKEAELAQAGEIAALAQLRANARPEVLMGVVKCGAGHLMRADDYDVHRSSCGRTSVLPVTEQDLQDLDRQEGEAALDGPISPPI
jgi:hypothetical protein